MASTIRSKCSLYVICGVGGFKDVCFNKNFFGGVNFFF